MASPTAREILASANLNPVEKHVAVSLAIMMNQTIREAYRRNAVEGIGDLQYDRLVLVSKAATAVLLARMEETPDPPKER